MSNLWLSYTFIAASIFATINLVDKVVLDGKEASSDSVIAASLHVFPMCLVYLAGGALTNQTGALGGSLSQTDLFVLVFAASIGIVYMFFRNLYLKGLHLSEVSRFIPLLTTEVIFVALLAFVFLGETFPTVVYVGIGVLFFGGVLISLDDLSQGFAFASGTAVVIGVVAALALAVVNTSIDFVTGRISLFTILFWKGIGGLVAITVALSIWGYRNRASLAVSDVRSVTRTDNLFLMFGGAGTAIAYFSIAKALEGGPVSLIAAILNLDAFLVFLGVVTLSKLTPEVLRENMNRIVFTQKFVASMMILAGVAVVEYHA